MRCRLYKELKALGWKVLDRYKHVRANGNITYLQHPTNSKIVIQTNSGCHFLFIPGIDRWSNNWDRKIAGRDFCLAMNLSNNRITGKMSSVDFNNAVQRGIAITLKRTHDEGTIKSLERAAEAIYKHT